MAGLESEEEVVPRRNLWFKPMSWLGHIRPHRRDETWSTSSDRPFLARPLDPTFHSLWKCHPRCVAGGSSTHKVKTQQVRATSKALTLVLMDTYIARMT